MTRDWSDVNARVAGLSTRLLTPGSLAELRAARGLAELVAALASTRYGPVAPAGTPTPQAFEEAVRRTVVDRLALLDRWLGRRREALRVVYEDEERRSIRALLRGAAQGAPAEQRLSGLIPTPALTETVLERLARAPDPLAVVGALEAAGHPFAADLREAGVGATVDLYRLELALDRGFARRAGETARHPALAAYVERLVDLGNAWALLLAEPPGPVTAVAPDPFVEGGRRIDGAEFARIAAEPDPWERRRMLADRFTGSGLARVFDPADGPRMSLEAAALDALVDEQARTKRRDPAGPAPVLLYALRLRRDVVELRRILWALALGRPRAEASRSRGAAEHRAVEAGA